MKQARSVPNIVFSFRLSYEDLEHSYNEKRFYCLGRVSGGI